MSAAQKYEWYSNGDVGGGDMYMTEMGRDVEKSIPGEIYAGSCIEGDVQKTGGGGRKRDGKMCKKYITVVHEIRRQ